MTTLSYFCQCINDSFYETQFFHQESKPVKVIPHLYPTFIIVKLGYAEVNLFYLFLLQNIDRGFSRRGGSNVYRQSMFRSKNKKTYKNSSTENFQFLQLQKILYIAWACFRNGIVLTTHFTNAVLLSHFMSRHG